MTTAYTPIESNGAAGWTHTASSGISQARSQNAYNDAIKLGLSVLEANQIAFWAHRQNMSNRGF